MTDIQKVANSFYVLTLRTEQCLEMNGPGILFGFVSNMSIFIKRMQLLPLILEKLFNVCNK